MKRISARFLSIEKMDRRNYAEKMACTFMTPHYKTKAG
eukprot:CAMPEP_0171842126 /NCGR_PEP_ID=MMETSP0992-20121227/15001_1 /TAXON_ID=483369 /ORGANISM="non described non described, Strain CCMP2098" /LENGTH=37 /DNA_ID= /DNA_START= /DNA_END= /DNA_ORIENTATION=